MSDVPKVYLVRAGRNGEDEDSALTQNLAIIGFQDVPSLNEARDYDGVFALVSEALAGNKPRALGNFAGQLWAFAILMQVGDIVVMPRKLTSQIAIGRVTGPYQYRAVNGENRHTRAVEWLLPEVPRSTFAQDLLYSFGAFMTVCNIARNDAVRRVQAILEGKPDPGLTTGKEAGSGDDQTETLPDLAQLAHDQIVKQIQARFVGHDLTRLVNAVLQADGWVTTVSPPGPDGGVDSSHLVDVIYQNYERLPAEIQAELPLKRVWMLVQDDAAE